MTEEKAMFLLWPALSYPNCAVRQARLFQVCRALLCTADTADQTVVEEIVAGWKEQDELKLFALKSEAAAALGR